MATFTQSQKDQVLAERVFTSTPPKKSFKGFFLVENPPKTPKTQQAQTPLTPAQTQVQVPLKQRYAQAKHELQRLYQQAQPKQQHTLAEQAVFVQTYRSAVELLEVFYSQATGQLSRETEQQLQQRYTQAVELLKLFYSQAQQPPDAWKQSQRMFFDIYVQAQEPQ